MIKSWPRIEQLIRGQRIAIVVDVSLGQALVECVGSNRVTHLLGCRGGIVEAIAATEHGLVRQAERNPNSRREVILVGANQGAAYAESRLRSRSDPTTVVDDSSVKKRECTGGGNNEASMDSRVGVYKTRVEVNELVIILSKRRNQFIA